MSATSSRIEDERPAGALAVLLAVAGMAYANFAISDSENGGVGPFAVSVVVSAALAAVLFGRVLPAAASLRRAAWWLAGIGVLTLAVFWSGLPMVLGVAAVYAGRGAQAPAPAAIGAATVVAGLVGCVVG